MKHLKTLNVLLLGLCILLPLIACSGPATEMPAETTTAPKATDTRPGGVIVLGDISDDPGEVIEGSQPLAEYLAERLDAFGITQGQVIVVDNADEMITLLKQGKVDLYFDSVYPATLISDASGAQPILRRWRYGVEDYYSVIFTRADSGITSLDDLPGHMLALDTPFSTSGYLLPVVKLINHGLKITGKTSYEDPVAEDEVGFVFSYDDENTLQWVLSGLVAAGATDDYHFEVAYPPEVRENMIALAQTDSVPRQVVVARPGMDPALLEAIKEILTTIHENEEGLAVLEPFQTTRFDEFPEGIEAAQERMREMMELVQEIPLP